MVMKRASGRSRPHRRGIYLASLLSLHEAMMVSGKDPGVIRLLDILLDLEAGDDPEIHSEEESEEFGSSPEQEGFVPVDTTEFDS